MFIVAKSKRAQFVLKGQCVLVAADLKKIRTVLPRTCDEECLVSLALKCRLTDRTTVCQQHIQPSAVNKALLKLIEINYFYVDVKFDRSWEDLSKEFDPELWSL